MAQATVKTVQYLDPRIEPQPDPVYDYVIGPTQNQYYQIPASGLSDSSITFNNLTTLGVDRAYLDTFEIEIGATITFTTSATGVGSLDPDDPDERPITCPDLEDWVFESFPFNKCCDEARVNINGGAFFSQPMCYIRAKERYMNQERLHDCYQNVCPIQRAVTQTESGRNYNRKVTQLEYESKLPCCVNSRLGRNCFVFGRQQSPESPYGGYNNDIIQSGAPIESGIDLDNTYPLYKGYENYYRPYMVDTTGKITKDDTLVVKVRWREPLFVSPFSSRYDATYGRPLYNITSMDLSFTLQNLGNMIRYANPIASGNNDQSINSPVHVISYNVHITSAKLCYQVMTIPPILNKPLTTLVPYRRFVPYVTDYNQMAPETTNLNVKIDGDTISITSGVYTFNEIPTAIWIFAAPCKDILQTNKPCNYKPASGDVGKKYGSTTWFDSWDSNKLFAYIKSVNISMANTTQILATAKPLDLYRIAKANGCEDSYWSWGGNQSLVPSAIMNHFSMRQSGQDGIYSSLPSEMPYGAGSVLRLKPGVDLIVPDQPLIPGANANNMVFQCSAQFVVPPHAEEYSKYSLWLLFEYVGVAAISPGQCEITMNPLGSGEIMAVSPVMSATSESTEGTLEGSGFWDVVKRATGIAGQLADDGIISMILKHIPGAKPVADWAKKHGLGEPCAKRTRGGAVMGKGLNDWI